MGIMVSKDLEQKSELNRRIASDLRDRTWHAEQLRHSGYDDEVETVDTKKTGRFTWVWVVFIILAIIFFFCILFI